MDDINTWQASPNPLPPPENEQTYGIFHKRNQEQQNQFHLLAGRDYRFVYVFLGNQEQKNQFLLLADRDYWFVQIFLGNQYPCQKIQKRIS